MRCRSGLGGLATILDVKIMDWPTHAASKPIAMIPNCAANRHAHFTLDGSGPVYLEAPKLDEWPDVNWTPSKEAKRVNLDADRKSTRLNSSHYCASRMPSSA